MITIEDLSKSFGEIPAVASVSLEVREGESVGVVGPSGSGKTTLMRLIAGLELPDSGEIRLGPRKVSGPGWALEPHLRGIGFVFQEPALWPHMTVEQNITYGMSVLSRREASARLDDLLAASRLETLRRRRPDQLSMGQARCVAVVRALAPRPERLLMDEPLTNLDSELKAEMIALIRSSAAETGASLVYVSHILEEVEAAVGRVVRMESGRLQAGS